MAKGPNNHGDTLVSSEKQLEIKRAKKAAQNADARANAHNGNRSSLAKPLNQQPFRRPVKPMLLGAVRDPKEIAKEQALAATSKQREQEALDFRLEQAKMARDSTNVTSLNEGSPARKIAVRVISLFPTVVVEKEKTGRGRFAEAVDIVLAELSELPEQNRPSDKARVMGIERAKWSLNKAYATLSNKS